jgi:hypothetical protein
MFVKSETLFGYEHGSPYRIYDETFDKLLDEVAEEDYSIYKLPDRLCCRTADGLCRVRKAIDIHKPADRKKLAVSSPRWSPGPTPSSASPTWSSFCTSTPKLPKPDKRFVAAEPIRLDPAWSRRADHRLPRVHARQESIGDLAFYAYRDMTRCDWQPFLKASLERSPVSINVFREDTIDQAASTLSAWRTETRSMTARDWRTPTKSPTSSPATASKRRWPTSCNMVMQTCWAGSFYFAEPGFITLLNKTSIIWVAGFSLIFFVDERALLKSVYFWIGLLCSWVGIIGVIRFQADFRFKPHSAAQSCRLPAPSPGPSIP